MNATTQKYFFYSAVTHPGLILLYPLLPFVANIIHICFHCSVDTGKEKVYIDCNLLIYFLLNVSNTLFSSSRQNTWHNMWEYIHTHRDAYLHTYIHILSVKLCLVWRREVLMSRKMGLTFSTWHLFLV